MKLAEALFLRADYQKRLDQLKQRLLRNARVQEGETPAEDPIELQSQFEQLADQLTTLIQRINRTNIVTLLDPPLTLSDALAVRDSLKLRHQLLRDLAQAATISQERYSKSEIKIKSTVNVTEVQQRADQLAQEHRLLDARIQEINWRTELVA